jgi:hypothetical protein
VTADWPRLCVPDPAVLNIINARASTTRVKTIDRTFIKLRTVDYVCMRIGGIKVRRGN